MPPNYFFLVAFFLAAGFLAAFLAGRLDAIFFLPPPLSASILLLVTVAAKITQWPGK